jgi:glycosyltransferase involved in cell wall biosynthesis
LVNQRNRKNIYLDIIGTGNRDYVKGLQDLINDLRLEERVRFLGYLAYAQILKKYGDYDALLCTPRWEEPFTISIIEAMARGLLVFATISGGNSEIISHGVNGILVPKDDPATLAHAIEKTMKDPTLVQSMRLNALDTVRSRYVLDQIIDKTEEYLRQVFQDTGGKFASS